METTRLAAGGIEQSKELPGDAISRGADRRVVRLYTATCRHCRMKGEWG